MAKISGANWRKGLKRIAIVYWAFWLLWLALFYYMYDVNQKAWFRASSEHNPAAMLAADNNVSTATTMLMWGLVCAFAAPLITAAIVSLGLWIYRGFKAAE